MSADTFNDGDETIALWPGPPPGGEDVTVIERIEERTRRDGRRDRRAHDVTRPILSVFKPARANGAALLLIPGGAYRLVAVDVEGMESARRWSERGVTAFVLRYRLPSDRWASGPDTALQDAQRAMRLIRARADAYKVDPGRVAICGFSAGGHLAGSLATRFADTVYAPVDEADALSARPDVAAMIYPVVTMRGAAHENSRNHLLGMDQTASMLVAYSLDTVAPADTPPTFLAHAADDESVVVENSLLMFEALRRAGVASALHIFEKGGHGFGLRGATGLPVAAWPELFEAFARRHGWIGASPSTVA